MNEMELVTDVPVIEMEMEVVTRNYPVIPNPEGTPTDDISSMEIDNVIYAVKDETARTELDNKVDKVEGKGLSEEDFTHTLKAKLDGIENGAEVNVQSDFAQSDNSADDFIKNKPTKLSDFDNDEGFIDKSVNDLENYYKKSETYTKSEVNSALDLKVDKVNGKGLSTNDYDDTAKGIVDNVTTNLATKVDKDGDKVLSDNNYSDNDKTKLDGIEAEANKTVVDNSVTSTSTNPVESKAIYNLLNDLLPEATATGNPIAITNASGLNAKSLKVELEPIQDLHGYDKPWVGGAGKNKCASFVNETTTRSYYNCFEAEFNIQPNTTYTISFKGVVGNKIYTNEQICTYIIYTITSGVNSITVTTKSEIPASQYLTNKGWILFKNSGDQAESQNFSEVQIELGSTATSYEPYENICPISGRTQTTVSVNSEDTTIQFGQTVYGGEVDVTNGGTKEDWYYRKDKISDYSAGQSIGDFTRKNLLCENGTATDKNIPAVCDKLPYLLSYSGNQLHFYVDNEASGKARIYIFVPNDIDTNTEVEVAFKLQTPSSTISTPSNEISLLKGSNTLTADGDMELIYSKTPQ